MEAKREYTYRIEPRDVDFMKRATLMSLADYILHTAGEDADRNGFGVRDLNLHNASWVLTRMALETVRMPEEYEQIRITTWVSDVTRVMTTRNFEVLEYHCMCRHQLGHDRHFGTSHTRPAHTAGLQLHDTGFPSSCRNAPQASCSAMRP